MVTPTKKYSHGQAKVALFVSVHSNHVHMTFSNSNKARLQVFIDESIDGSETNYNRYVISSVVINSDVKVARAEFEAAGFRNGFKASKYGRPVRHGRLRNMSRWLETQDFNCFAVALKPIESSFELTRQIALKEIFNYWAKLGYDRYFMDSRDHLEARDGKMNGRDISTMSSLIAEDSLPRNSHISFHKDEEDFRFAIADFTAFIVRRHLALEEQQFLFPIQKKIRIKDLSGKARGR
jgi:hypothetical protein